MSLENMDNAALCQALLDPTNNGNRGVAELVDHMEHDALVAWGGARREPQAGADRQGRIRFAAEDLGRRGRAVPALNREETR
jgi:hypothetical protein